MAMSLLRFCFFFFKQKTAYDMRISDWSSDVCSSDLVTARFDLREVENVLQQGQQMAPGAFDAVDILMLLLVEHPGIAEAQELRVADHAVERGPQPVADRKSVVSGKSVSVRVDLGGRSIIKKKTTYNQASVTQI